MVAVGGESPGNAEAGAVSSVGALETVEVRVEVVAVESGRGDEAGALRFEREKRLRARRCERRGMVC
jgi:hypothetical protein